MKRFFVLSAAFALLISATGVTQVSRAYTQAPPGLRCDNGRLSCTEVLDSELVFGEDRYIGHDEPSLLFYSNVPGSGNSMVYKLRLPKDPPQRPTQDGTGGTFNFQLHPAFWFGMALCDTESAPNFSKVCNANTDDNIFDSATPTNANYIGKHPGTAFVELQFYPPGWVQWPQGNSCDPELWCAAMAIFSLSTNQNNAAITQNADCLNKVGIEPANFAFLTKNGRPHAPVDPLKATLATFTPNRETDLFMRSGDVLTVDLHDTAAGLQTVIRDLSSEKSGSMTASVANDFAQVRFQPSSATCNTSPYAFHPMYSTSSERTRVVWAAHSYNIAFSDEIGHFEYCEAVDPRTGLCTKDGVFDADRTASGTEDDTFCFAPPFAGLAEVRIKVGGCLAIPTDADFDGPPYHRTWPGSLPDRKEDARRNPESILFTSPLIRGRTNYSRVAFEADLPRIELDTNPPCIRSTGANCVNPPPGAEFYPLFTARGRSRDGDDGDRNGDGERSRQDGNRNGDEGDGDREDDDRALGNCVWQFGGANIPGTTNTFGGTSTAEFGPLLLLTYPGTGFTPFTRYNNFRRVLTNNPCRP